MSDVPNYRSLSAPDEKPPGEYSWAERRSEIYDLIERAGHYRNLEQSTRQLGDRFGVSHTQIRKDIQAINEWMADNLGGDAEAELETLKTRAVQDLIDRGDTDKAYYLMMNHYETLMDAGAADQIREPEKQEITGEGGAPLAVEINRGHVPTEDTTDEHTGD